MMDRPRQPAGIRARSRGDRTFDLVSTCIFSVILVIMLFPLYFVLIASVSDPDAINTGKVLFYPVGFSLEGFRIIAADSRIWIGYRNSFFYTVAGTLLNVVITLLTAYPLSREDLAGRRGIMWFFLFTMYFSGGLIPTYLLVNSLRLYNTPYVLIVLGTLSVYNMIIARTFFSVNIPKEMLEAARIDGCTDFTFFFRIVMPLSKAIVAVLAVYYAVGHWNQYFNALIYISDQNLYPLQMVLREILIQNSTTSSAGLSESMMEEMLRRERYGQMIKYGVIVVASVPMLCIYPFAQKYFIRGVMIGAVKG